MERFIENTMYASRWLLAPIYFGLSLAVLALTLKFFQELYHLLPHVFEKTEHLAEHASAHPNCPNCGSQSVQHAPAPFVAVTQRKS